jgi:GH24 family phage-related lysozyme (muramidase)
MYSYNVTDTYINWLKDREAFSAKAYKDGYVGGVQSYSIGYGHQIQAGESFLRTATLTKDQALVYLKKNVKDVVDYVNKNSTKPHTQGTFQACVDYGYNAGVGALQKNVLALHNAGAAYSVVAKNISITRDTSTTNGVSKTNPELVARRKIEANWYNGSVLGSASNALFTIILIPFIAYAIYLFNGEKIPFYN